MTYWDNWREDIRMITFYNERDDPDSAFSVAMNDAKGHLWRIDDKLRVAQLLLFEIKQLVTEENRYHDPKNIAFVQSDWDRKSLLAQMWDEIDKMKEKIQ